MAKTHVWHRVATELIAALAVPALCAGILVLPVAAAFVAELDRIRARFCGRDVVALRPAGCGWGRWTAERWRSAPVWRTDVPVYLSGLLLATIGLLVAFFGFIGAVVLVFEPVFWAFGVRAQVGPFTPATAAHAWIAVPVGMVLGAVTTVLMTLFSVARDALLGLFSGQRDPALIAKVEELRRSRASLSAAFEAEQRRIERDLHDGAQQELVMVIMKVGMLEAWAGEQEDLRLADLAGQARQHAEHALERLRDTVREIHPRELSDFGLSTAIGELAMRSALRIRLRRSGDDGMLTAPTAAAVYFAVAEAVTNAAKYAGVPELSIDLRCESSTVTVSVTDKGVGGAHFDDGTGLAGLRERMRSVGGDLEVISPVGGGTSVRLWAPYQLPWTTSQEAHREDRIGR